VISKKEFTGLANHSPLFKGGDQGIFLFPEITLKAYHERIS
jgi:hypothetical protein